ncbi:RNA methyltransferase, TrmH family [Anaerosporobacter mobilis DSM 15930]|jgi:TrmH family RNA methyltransferase|uniref:RNA methyltransferase, TrmH family n=1 Tax=Anaerosporobacter mobilis DSM 15930 TaxID=1120996 RepID=A0A1M7GLX2_9FIRM|nr:TrmH family RNA methyltransferase [Anaerosporobacter mobilis]SHM16907.1 RNA methyltransferase, TrmH family [Anaerosporobacter mobilis DSM 15930]
MKTEKVVTKNATYQKFEVLKSNRNKRYKYQEFLVEGVRNINEAVKKGWNIKSILYVDNINLSDWAKGIISSTSTEINYILSEVLMKELSGKEVTSEIMAIIGMRVDNLDSLVLSNNPMIALFDRPSNKGNLGTIIRSCDALGVECLILTGHAVDLYDTDVVVSSMGSFFNMQIVRVPETQKVLDFIAGMHRRYPTFNTIGTTAHKEHPIYDLDLSGPVLFMIGNETDGLCNTFKDCCDLLATIPMAESSYASSFNVGCAATVMFYEASRQRYLYFGE